MENEIWLDIKDFEGRYQISNWGNVLSMGRSFIAKDGHRRTYPKRLLKLKPNKANGYCFVRLYRKDGNYLHISVHRLVALHFVDNPRNHNIVNHINTITDDNNALNLEWCSLQYNLTFKGASKRSGEKRKKKVYQYHKDGSFIKSFLSATDAEIDGFNRTAISKACNGKRDTHLGFVWKHF